MEWVVVFFVIFVIGSIINNTEKSTPPRPNEKLTKPRVREKSSASQKQKRQDSTGRSEAKEATELEQKMRMVAESKAILWLQQQQQEIEDSLDTPEKRAQFHALKAKYFPETSGLRDSHSATKNPHGARSAPVAAMHPEGRIANKNLQKKDIQEAVQELGVEKLYHFTRASNLESILEFGILSVFDLENNEMPHDRNDIYRHDKRPTGISTSISFPNSRMFYKYRMIAPGECWVVLEIDPSILYELDCLFCRHNAADKRISQLSDSDLRQSSALKSMFSDEENFPRSPSLRDDDPTDEQAEVLVMEKIDPKYIAAVIFESYESYEQDFATIRKNPHIRFPSFDASLFNARQYVRNGTRKSTLTMRKKPNFRENDREYDDDIPF